jgi:phasin family protein
LTLLCVALYKKRSGGRVLPAGQRDISLGKDSIIMVKVEDFQQYGKEHLETVVASAATLQTGFQAIASAYGDYTKKSFEDTKSFVEKLSGVKSLDKAIEAQTEFAKSSYETFVAESQKIAGLYSDLAKQTFKPLEGMVAKYTPAAH